MNNEKFICPECNQETDIENTEFTYDVCNIPFRRLCRKCANKIMENIGYDGRDYRFDCSEDI